MAAPSIVKASKGRNRRERGPSRWNGPARPTADRPVSTRTRFTSRPLAAKEIQMILVRVKTPESFDFFSLLRVHASRPRAVWFTHSRRRPKACAYPLRVRARARRSQAAAPHHGIHTARRVCALRLSLPLAYRFSQVQRGRLSGQDLHRPGGQPGPPPTPTHAPGSRPYLDRFVQHLVQSEYSRFFGRAA